MRRARGAAHEPAPGHAHLCAEPHVRARRCAGLRHPCALGAREAEGGAGLRRAGPEEARQEGGETRCRARGAGRGRQARQATAHRRRGAAGRGEGRGRARRRGAAPGGARADPPGREARGADAPRLDRGAGPGPLQGPAAAPGRRARRPRGARVTVPGRAAGAGHPRAGGRGGPRDPGGPAGPPAAAARERRRHRAPAHPHPDPAPGGASRWRGAALPAAQAGVQLQYAGRGAGHPAGRSASWWPASRGARWPPSGWPGGPAGSGRSRSSGGAVTGERPRNFGPDAQKGGARKKKKGRKTGVDQDAVLANIEKTLAGMHRGTAKRTGRRDDGGYREQLLRQKEEREREKTRIRVNEFISVSELADLMKVPASQIVQLAFKGLGLMVTVNQRLDFDQIELISSEFGFEAVKEEEYAAPEDSAQVVEEDDAQQVARPPVVTIMGHVDHGKTSLLDYIRKANVVAGEAGGITQHIGAYHVTLPDGRKITFLDTPGHQAFTAMRARGAQVTDIVVLVVSAEDAVMPQTVEAISHAKNAGVPMIVAINKIDLPAANVQKVKQDLLSHSVVLEEFGGQVLSTAISAKKGTNVEKLLEQILLQAEILDLKANPERSATGTVVEATLDPGKGPVATILVQKGTLHVGDNFICGKFSGRVRALYDERGKNTKVAGPSIPVQILGFEGTPSPGDNFLVTTDAVEAREIAQKRQRLEREAQNRRTARGGSLEDISRALAQGQMGALRLIIKADQGGPAEALADALGQLSTGEVRVDIVHRGVGSISESDVLLAKASGAIIIGFHVRPDGGARAAAEREQVDVRTYRIIYEAVDDVRNALEGLLKPESRETVLGDAEVMQLFKVSKVGTIAGCQVRHGTIVRTAKVRVLRDGVQVYDGMLSSLKRFKDDVREVKEGLECGIGVENFNDVKVGDMIEAYRVEEIKRTLAGSGSGAA
ncbi:MAG: translation initiation factor IF-2 [Gemmatimonadetes bacterium]|nr:translation initiation factor IF-2 [Gemmatimonadota bacterium]